MKKILLLVLIMMTVISFNTVSDAAKPVMRLYTDKNYGGKEVTIWSTKPNGEFLMSEIAYSTEVDGGIPEKSLSSFWLAKGYVVIFYENINLKGASIRFTGGAYKYIGDEWNDRVSSYRLEKEGRI